MCWHVAAWYRGAPGKAEARGAPVLHTKPHVLGPATNASNARNDSVEDDDEDRRKSKRKTGTHISGPASKYIEGATEIAGLDIVECRMDMGECNNSI